MTFKYIDLVQDFIYQGGRVVRAMDYQSESFLVVGSRPVGIPAFFESCTFGWSDVSIMIMTMAGDNV